MIRQRIRIIAAVCAAMVCVHLLNVMLGGYLTQFGIKPGQITSLPYIFSAPWLHAGWMHLMNNLMGITVFSALCLIRGPQFFFRSSIIIITLTGLLVWLFGRGAAVHVGASGWIFGLWSLSIAIAWFQRSFLNVSIAIFVAIFYGGMVWGLLSTNPYISFESHLFGAIAGIVAAYIMARQKPIVGNAEK